MLPVETAVATTVDDAYKWSVSDALVIEKRKLEIVLPMIANSFLFLTRVEVNNFIAVQSVDRGRTSGTSEDNRSRIENESPVSRHASVK